MEKLPKSFRKMSIRSGLNPEKNTIAEEKYKTGANNMVRRRSAPFIYEPSLER